MILQKMEEEFQVVLIILSPNYDIISIVLGAIRYRKIYHENDNRFEQK